LEEIQEKGPFLALLMAKKLVSSQRMEADQCASASHPLPVFACAFNNFGGSAD